MMTIGPDELPANLVRKCARCNDFTGEMKSVETITQHRMGAAGSSMGPHQTLWRDYRFKCTKCGGELRVPDGQTVLSLGAIAVLGLMVSIGGLSQGLWFAAPIGLLLAIPVVLAVYQRKKHPGMF